jgi:hypothetical protein
VAVVGNYEITIVNSTISHNRADLEASARTRSGLPGVFR